MAFDRYDEQVYMAYIEDDLLPDEAGTFEELLRDVNDPRLGELIAAMKQDRQAVISMSREQAPPRVMANISKIIEREKQLHPYNEPERAPLPATANDVAATTYHSAATNGAPGRSMAIYAIIGIAALILVGVLVVFAVMALTDASNADPNLNRDMVRDLEQQRSTLDNERGSMADGTSPGGMTDTPVPMPESPDAPAPAPDRVVDAVPPDEIEPAEAWTPEVDVAVAGRDVNELMKSVAFWAALNGAEVFDSTGKRFDIENLPPVVMPGNENPHLGTGSTQNATPESGSTTGTLGSTTITVELKPDQLPGLVQHINRDSREKAKLSIDGTSIDPASIDLVRNDPRNWRDLLIHHFGDEKAEEFRQRDGVLRITLELN